MSKNTENTETEYTQTESDTDYEADTAMTSTEDEDGPIGEKPVEKKKSNKILLVGIAVFVGVAGWLGYNTFLKSPEQPVQPVQQQPVQQPKPVEVQPVEPPKPVEAVKVQEGPDVLPDLGSKVEPNVVPVEQPVQVQQATPEVPPAPVVQENNPMAPVAPATPTEVAPLPVEPVSPVEASQPTLSESSMNSIDKLIDRIDSMEENINETMNSVKDMVTEQKGKVEKNTVDIKDLQERVALLEKQRTVVQETKPVVKKAVSSKKATVKKAYKPKNSVRLVSDDSYGDRVGVRSSSNKSVRSSSHKTSSAAPSGYTLQAVLPGRAWVKKSDGTTVTYSVGDTLPNGNKVGKIDPDGGIFDSSNKSWLNH